MNINALRRAVFIDRDGVINKFLWEQEPNKPETHYCMTPEQLYIPQQSLDGLGRLSELENTAIVVVSNQSCVGRGLATKEQIDAVFAKMIRQVDKAGGRIDMVRYCPHSPDAGCACRKPKPGMIYHAAILLGICLEESFVIGDSDSDIEAGRAAGCQTIKLMDNPDEVRKELERRDRDISHYLCASLKVAAEIVEEKFKETRPQT